MAGQNREINYQLTSTTKDLINGIARAVRALNDLGSASTNLKDRTDKVGISFSDVANKIDSVADVAKRVVGTLADFINESSEYIENLNLFNVAMGEYADSALEYANIVQNKLGIDNSDWIRTQGVLMTLATGFGIASDQAYEMSENLTKLSYDLASYYNLSFEKAQEKVRAGFAGQAKAVRDLGYDITQAAIDEAALALGIEKTAAEMTQAEKAMLRYYIMMTTVTQAQGDLSRTINAPANQFRLLQQQATLASRALGNALIPMVNAVMPYLIALARVVTVAAEAVANFLGFDIEAMVSSDYSGMASDLGVVEDAAGGIGDALDDAAASGGGAADSIKEIKSLISGFDELNIFKDEKATAGGGGGGSGGASSGGGGGSFDLPSVEYDTFLNGAIEDRVTPIFESMLETIKKLLPLLKTAAAILATLWVTTRISKFISWLDKVLDKNGALTKSWKKVQSALLAFLAGFAVGYLVTFLASLEGVTAGVVDLADVLGAVAIAVGAVITIMGALKGSMNSIFFGIGLVVGAVVALTQAYAQARREIAEGIIAADTGVSMEMYAEHVSAVSQAYIDSVQPTLDAAAAMQEASDKIGGITTNIETMMVKMQSSDEITSEMVDAMIGEFQKLHDESSVYIQGLGDTLITYLAGNSSLAKDEVTESVGRILEETSKMQTDADQLYDKIITLTSSLDGLSGVDLANAQKELEETTAQYFGLIDGPDKAAVSWSNYVSSFNASDLDLSDIEKTEEAMSTMSSKATEAINAVNEARDNALASAQEFLDYAIATGDTSSISFFEGMIEQINADYDAKIGEIESTLGGYAETIWSNFSAQWIQVFDSNLENLSFADKLGAFFLQGPVFGNYEPMLIEKAARETNDVFGEGITEGIQEFISKSDYAADFEGLASDALGGWKDGVLYSGINPAEIMSDQMAAVVRGTKTVLDIHSPSGIYEGIGENTLKGFKDGILAVYPEVESLLTTVFKQVIDVPKKELMESLGSLGEEVTDWAREIKNVFIGIKDSFSRIFTGVHIKLPHFSLSGNFNLLTKSVPTVRVNWYAQGGFPNTGEVFIANEAGPEMVGTIGNKTAVANNNQIVEAVSRGVAEAVSNTLGNRPQRVVLKIGDREIGEVAINYINSITAQTGEMPLEVI